MRNRNPAKAPACGEKHARGDNYNPVNSSARGEKYASAPNPAKAPPPAHALQCRSTVTFCSEGGNSQRLLTFCLQKGIRLCRVTPTPFGFRAQVAAARYAALRLAARRAGCKIRIQQKNGIWFWLAPKLKYIGILLGALAAGWLVSIKGLVWNIVYTGVDTVDLAVVQQTLYRAGVCPGSRVDDPTLDEAERLLLAGFDSYAAFSLNYGKGKLVVEGRKLTPAPGLQYPSSGNIYAAEDGVIRQLEIYAGEGLVKTGQTVQKGELLVQSGWLDQQGLYRLAPARAKVLAYIEKTVTVSCPMQMTQTVPGRVKRKLNGVVVCGHRLGFSVQGTGQLFTTGLQILGIPLPATLVYRVDTQAAPKTFTLTDDGARRQCAQTVDKLLAQSYPGIEVLDCAYEYTLQGGNTLCTARVRAVADIAATG